MINVRQVNKLESQHKDCISLENNAIPLSKDLQGETPSSNDKLYEAVDVPTLLVSSNDEPKVSKYSSESHISWQWGRMSLGYWWLFLSIGQITLRLDESDILAHLA